MTPLQTVLEVLEGVRKCGNGWSAKCPGHEDGTASLSIGEGSDGRVLLHCFAGCAFADIVRAAGVGERDLFPPEDRDGKREVARYAYNDEAGRELFHVRRYVPKTFRPYRPGAAFPGIDGVRRVLFRLPETIEAVGAGRVVYLPEGEKDVLALVGLGLDATTAPGGAAAPWIEAYSETVRDARVVIVADKEKAGRDRATKVATLLHGVAASVRVVEVPIGKDSSDWIAAGAMREDFENLSATDPGADVPTPEQQKAAEAFVSLPEVLRQNKPRRPIRTGVSWIDENTGGGLSPGEAVIAGGGPGTVKTTLITNLVENMASPLTALCLIAWDERWTKVAQKTGAQFGEPYSELTSAHPLTIDHLETRLAERDAFIRFVDPASGLPVEVIAETFDRVAPKDRIRIYLVDLLQLMESKDCSDDDTEQIETRRVVEALLRVVRLQEAIVFAISEATKAAIALEAVEANPLAVFATSRKIASRFDLPIAMAKLDETTVLCVVAKNRLGPTGKFRLTLDPVTWRLGCQEGRGEPKRTKGEAARAEADSEQQKILVPALMKAIASVGPASGRQLAAHLRGVQGVRFTETNRLAALAFIKSEGLATPGDGPREQWTLPGSQEPPKPTEPKAQKSEAQP
jgi:RecA/RadA recombinase